MFDTRKFGGYLSGLRKEADMTQSELADRLNITRQAVSRYELGDGFPEISILVTIADIFGVTVDHLIGAGEPTRAESSILGSIARGNTDIDVECAGDIVGIAPLLRPSVLAKLSSGLSKKGIDISGLVDLANYLNDESVLSLLENASFDSMDAGLLEKFLPMLDERSKGVIFEKILSGEIDWRFIEVLLPYAEHLTTQIEAAVIDGALPNETLKILGEYFWGKDQTAGDTHRYLCPNCKSEMTLSVCHACGYKVPRRGSVYLFCDDPGMNFDGEDKYIGYDSIGEDFEPEVVFYDKNNTERYGVYEACGDLIAKTFGTDITVLDLGAGLGSASIPLAKNGIYTVAADISEVMLQTAEKRARGRYESLVLARMNAYELMLPDKCVDIVVENAMLHLVETPEKVIREIARVLKPGGKLVRYGSPAFGLSDEERIKNAHCGSVLEDIYDRYYGYLSERGVSTLWFDNKYTDIIAEYFEKPYNVMADGFCEIFTDKLKFRLHRLKTGALSDLQHIGKEILDAAWEYTDAYARGKYGDDYVNIEGFSKYGAAIDVYTLRGAVI